MDNTLKESLELAALVDGRSFEWAPQDDDADSRRLEIACLRWVESNIVTYPESVDDAQKLLKKARRSGDAEQYRAAVLDLAVAIGRVIKEQGHD